MTEYATVDYGAHPSDEHVHLVALEFGESLCGLEAPFDRVDGSDSTEDGFCPECEATERPAFDEEGNRISEEDA